MLQEEDAIRIAREFIRQDRNLDADIVRERSDGVAISEFRCGQWRVELIPKERFGGFGGGFLVIIDARTGEVVETWDTQ